jgi:hypothetical protein
VLKVDAAVLVIVQLALVDFAASISAAHFAALVLI